MGDIEEPVIYVHHQPMDYNGNLVTKGLPNPFVESLTHDSIIVQIPRLHGQINNRLDMVLSIFDQTRKDEMDEHILRLDEQVYSDDRDMERIIHRLTMAAADADMRHRMNVEDEYFSIIEKRDTEILLKDQQLAEKNAQLAEKSAELAEKSAELTEKSAELTEKSAELAEKSAELTEKNAQLTEKDAELTEKNAQLTEKDAELTEKNAQLTEKDAQLTEQKAMLRTSIQMLVKAGMSAENIAESLGKDIEEVRQLMH